jgi:hypothetical protein
LQSTYPQHKSVGDTRVHFLIFFASAVSFSRSPRCIAFHRASIVRIAAALQQRLRFMNERNPSLHTPRTDRANDRSTHHTENLSADTKPSPLPVKMCTFQSSIFFLSETTSVHVFWELNYWNKLGACINHLVGSMFLFSFDINFTYSLNRRYSRHATDNLQYNTPDIIGQ